MDEAERMICPEAKFLSSCQLVKVAKLCVSKRYLRENPIPESKVGRKEGVTGPY